MRALALASTAVRAVARAWGGLRWYVTTLLGDHDYARYVEHLARLHPDAEPETVREYWRARHEGAATQARCC